MDYTKFRKGIQFSKNNQDKNEQGAVYFDETDNRLESQENPLIEDGTFGTGSNKAEFEDDGTLKFLGEATVWDDVRVPGSLVTTGSSNAPDLVSFKNNLKLYSFDGGNTSEMVYFNIQLPHKWKQSSTIYPHVHWSPSTNNTGDVVWFFEYSWANINEVFPSSTTISVTQAAGGTAYTSKIASLPSIAGTNKNISSILICRLYRDPTNVADTYPDDAFLLDFDLHIEIDTLGSREPLVK